MKLNYVENFVKELNQTTHIWNECPDDEGIDKTARIYGKCQNGEGINTTTKLCELCNNKNGEGIDPEKGFCVAWGDDKWIDPINRQCIKHPVGSIIKTVTHFCECHGNTGIESNNSQMLLIVLVKKVKVLIELVSVVKYANDNESNNENMLQMSRWL